MVKLYNTATKQKESLTKKQGETVRMYCCGPTVYSTAHIGNMRTMIMNDLLDRTLRFCGYQVDHIMNITDVGHLTDDDADKMEKAAAREQKTAQEIAAQYTEEFLRDFASLNCLLPRELPRATAYISEQIAMVSELMEKGIAYQTHDGIYFDTAQFADYGKLSGQKLEEKEEGARVAVNDEKRNPSDFALWKFSPTDQKRQMEWESPWGVGFPGWHIECSAMSHALLPHPLDIHTGGIDLISPHHENEIAQSESLFGKPFARTWVHGAFILVDGQKMAKSIGNIYNLSQLREKNIDVLAYRYLLLQSHYRSIVNFTLESLQAAANGLTKLRKTISALPRGGAIDETYLAQFVEKISDDMDMPGAVALVHEVIKSELPEANKRATIEKIDEVLALDISREEKRDIPQEIIAIANRRETARQEKNWALSDELRDEITAKGFTIEDTKDGYQIS